MTVIRSCRQCGAEVRPTATQVRKGYGWFCSRKCGAQWKSAEAKRNRTVRSCERCGAELKGAWTRARFCSTSCSAYARWAAKPRTTPRYRYLRAPGHPLANKNGTVLEHRMLLFAKIGAGPHPCHWCGKPVRWTEGAHTARWALIVDHVDNDGRNNQPSNLVPSCHRCNVNRGSSDLVQDSEVFIDDPNRRGRLRAVERTCPCGKNFLTYDDKRRPNKGRFCSRSCARRRWPEPA